MAVYWTDDDTARLRAHDEARITAARTERAERFRAAMTRYSSAGDCRAAARAMMTHYTRDEATARRTLPAFISAAARLRQTALDLALARIREARR